MTDTPTADEPRGAASIQDAIRIVMRENNCGADEATRSLRDRAYAHSVPLEEVAATIVGIDRTV